MIQSKWECSEDDETWIRSCSLGSITSIILFLQLILLTVIIITIDHIGYLLHARHWGRGVHRGQAFVFGHPRGISSVIPAHFPTETLAPFHWLGNWGSGTLSDLLRLEIKFCLASRPELLSITHTHLKRSKMVSGHKTTVIQGKERDNHKRNL